MTWKFSDALDKQSRKNEFITLECTTKRFQVQQEVNSDVNFGDVNVNIKLSFLKLIYGTSLVKIAKEINCVLLKNAKLKWFKIQNFRKSWKLSIAKYANLIIAKFKCRENLM